MEELVVDITSEDGAILRDLRADVRAEVFGLRDPDDIEAPVEPRYCSWVYRRGADGVPDPIWIDLADYATRDEALATLTAVIAALGREIPIMPVAA